MLSTVFSMGAVASAQPSDVLLVGHSQVNHHVPGYLAWIMESSGQPRSVERQMIWGANLEENYVLHAQTADTRDPSVDPDARYFYCCTRHSSKGADALAELATGGYESLVITEEHGLTQAQARQLDFRVSHGVIFPGAEFVNPQGDAWLLSFYQPTHSIAAGLGLYHNAVVANATARVFLYENFFPVVNGATHDARINGGLPTKQLPELNSWRKRAAAYAPAWEGLASEMNVRRGQLVPGFSYGVLDIPDTQVAVGAPVTVIPVAQALSVLFQRACAGQAGGLSNPNALFQDHVHMNHLGNYFVALVMYAAIEESSPEGISLVGSPLGRGADGSDLEAPDPAVSAAMQKIAWDVVSGAVAADTTDILFCPDLGQFVPQWPGDPSDTEVIPDYNAAPSAESPGVIPSSAPPLRISRDSQSGRLDLDWGGSCASVATGYSIHEGTIGAWYDHESVVCGTSGALSHDDLLPEAGSRYFLVVPTSVLAEGSYGQGSSGLERPPSNLPCLQVSSRRGCP